VARGLTAFTPHTIVSPDLLAADLERVRHAGYAVDREEFDENFCCIAAPIFDARGRFIAALGLSMTANIFDSDREQLAPIVVDVAQHAARRTDAAAPSGAADGEHRRLASVS
jgi:acetyl-CoA synthetase